MADQTIVTELLLQAGQFIAEAQKAAKASEEIGRKSKQTADEASSGFDRLKKSARDNANEWQTVGGHLLKVGAGVTALGTAVAVVGVNYNRLQQSSRAAMTTLLGGTIAANAQMDKLDAWAKGSPFSKAVWIEAQQQLIAFGVHANKVIPYMSAIQDAVAAAGGSEAHLRGITEIMAKIQSSAKITGQDLNQFGNWGVDAAGAIGLAMGKTGAQIREEITAGTIGADQALDALAQGMTMKFGGAAANVKNTFDGAFDRVRAAFRDLSASMMEPFVGKQGGGLFVSWLNGAADFLRMLERMPGPVKDLAVGMGVATAAVTLGGGAFMMAAPKVLEMHRAMQVLGDQGIPIISRLTKSWASVPGHLKGIGTELSAVKADWSNYANHVRIVSADGSMQTATLASTVRSNMGRIGSAAKSAGNALLGAFGGWGGLAATVAIVGLTTAVTNYSRKQQEAKQFAAEFADTLDKVTGSATRATAALVADKMMSDNNLMSAIKFLSEHGSSISNEMFAKAVMGDAQAVARLNDELETFLKMDGRVGSTGEQLNVAATNAMSSYQGMTGAISKNREEQDAANKITQAASEGLEVEASAADSAAASTDDLADSTEEAASANETYLASLKGLVDFERQRADGFANLIKAENGWSTALNDVEKQLKDNGQTMDRYTEKGINNRAFMVDMASAAHDLVDAWMAQTDAQGNALYSAEEMADGMQDLRNQFIETAIQLGATAEDAADMADSLGLIPSEVHTRTILDNATAKSELRAMLAEFDDVPEELITNLYAHGDQAMEMADLVAMAIEEGVPIDHLTTLLAQDNASRVARDVQLAVDSIRQEKAPRIEVADHASTTIRNIANQIFGLKDKTVTITTHQRQTGSGYDSQAQFRAFGGRVSGPGGPTADLIPAWLSNEEHVWTARESLNVGHDAVYRIRALARENPFALRDALGLAGGGTPSHGGRPMQVMSAPFAASSQPVQVVVQPAAVDLSLTADVVLDGKTVGHLANVELQSLVGAGARRVLAAPVTAGGSPGLSA